MSIAAVPGYLQKDDPEFYLSAPPGHRFLLYFAVWGENQETERIDWRMKDRVPRMRRKDGKLIQQGWDDVPNDHHACTIAACKTLSFDEERPRKREPKSDPGLKPWRPLIDALCQRQQQLFSTIPQTQRLSLEARSIAPFTTGLGNEHPLENGFAFLNPYGLPYLPGSGVKGVLRQAARELASGDWGDTHGWSAEARFPLLEGPAECRKPMCDKNQQPILLTQADVLFGRETPAGESEHVRGVLSFWDVIPQLAGNSLAVEIMTPHQGHYYQKKSERKTGDSTSPHESGQPVPIPFLTVPPGSGFAFHVVCDLPRLRWLAPELAQDDRWKTMLTAAFEHAFAWLGFGAKTAVGYGAMARLNEEQVTAAREQAEALQLRCDWVDQTVRELASKNRASESDTLRSKGLAEAWAAISDADLKARALADIRARWSQAGWWDAPPGGSAKKAKAIYEAGE